MNSAPLRRLPVLLAFPAILGAVIGCSDGGCGGDSKGPERVAKEDNGGMGAPSHGGGGTADIRVSRFDSSKQKKAEDTPQKQAQTAAAEAPPPPIPRVGPKDFKPKVLDIPNAFLIVSGSGCPECDAAAPVLQGLASDFKSQYTFYLLNGRDPASLRRLPKGFNASPPAFVLYQDGKAMSMRKGLPLRAQAGEKAEDYQARLAQWFRDALIARDLNLK